MPASLTSDTKISEPLSNQFKSFLSTFESARDLLSRRLIQESHAISEHELNYAILSSILQALFLKIVQECGYAEHETLALLASSEGISRRMARACSDAGLIPDILFEKWPGNSFQIPVVPDDALREVIRCLDSEEFPAPISSMALEDLAVILEHFLGTRIRVEEGYRVKCAAKSSGLSAGSVNVPAKAVIEYLVKETLIDAIMDFESGRRTAIRILDPACGAGIFLLTAFRFLARRKTGHTDRSENRREILQCFVCQSVYGVDIDPESITVARFVLLLSFIEEYKLSGSGYVSSECLREICGCLKGTIRCGNALIARDYFSGGQEHPFNAEERNKVNPFSWQEAFPKIFNDGGFDAVIGAPPQYRPFTVKSKDEYFQTHYEVYAKGAGLYGYFIEKGLQILNPEGSLAFCIPNSFLRTNPARPLRKFLLTKQIEEIVDFGDPPVFKNATTYPCIIRVSNNKPVKEFCVSKVEKLDFPSLDGYVKEHRHPMDQHSLTDGGWTLSDKRTENLLKKLQSSGSPLQEYVMGEVHYGIKTGLNNAFVIDEITKKKLIEEDPKSEEIIKPFVVGRDIKRYTAPDNAGKYLIFTRHGIEIKKNPAILNYLKQFKTELMPKLKEWKGEDWKGRKSGAYEWYEIQDTIDYYEEFEKPKIIYPEICQKPEFTLDKSKFYANNKCFIIPRDDKFLLGILNSKLMYFLFKTNLPKLQAGFFMPAYVVLKNFPIYTPDFDNPDDKARHDRMVKLVTEMLELHKHMSQAKTDQEKRLITQDIESIDREIDSLVFALYGLTADEIKIIEYMA